MIYDQCYSMQNSNFSFQFFEDSLEKSLIDGGENYFVEK